MLTFSGGFCVLWGLFGVISIAVVPPAFAMLLYFCPGSPPSFAHSIGDLLIYGFITLSFNYRQAWTCWKMASTSSSQLYTDWNPASGCSSGKFLPF